MKFASLALCLSIIFLGGPALAASPPPLDPIIINFQGRIEVNDVGYTGASWFAFTIGNAGITESYWHGRASTTCSYGIYNILLGKDTDEALTADIFNQNTDLYMRVAFTNDTDGVANWEQLTPDQQITGVAFAVNADLLDGRESPDSDIVGEDDAQTLTNKILGSGTSATYFLVQPAADPGGVPEGYIWYDSANHALKVRVADSKWVVLTGDSGGTASGDWASGTGVATGVTYWTSETAVSGELDFTYDPATDKISLMNNGTAGALWITQSGLLTTTGVDADAGGALHVYNSNSLGSAITAYSNQTSTSSLVWFRASYQPVLRVEGNSGWANPFWIVPQQHWAGANGYTVQTGEMYMGVDGTLNYYRGDGWERLVGRWTVETGTWADNDAFAVTAQRNFNEGRPLRYRGDAGDPWLYGMVAAYAGGTVTVAGAALPNPLAEIEVGKPELIRQINFFEPGNLVQGDDFMSPNSWEMQDGYIVRATAKVETADDADAHIAIGIGAAGADLISGPGYLNLAQSTAKVATGVDIDTANYGLTFGDKIFVNVDQGGEPGNNLSVTLQVVTP